MREFAIEVRTKIGINANVLLSKPFSPPASLSPLTAGRVKYYSTPRPHSEYSNISGKGILIAGGALINAAGGSVLDTVEMFNMETFESCVVDVYNKPRHFHTGDGSLICGGYEVFDSGSIDSDNSLSSCYDVLTGNTINLNIQRARHCSWKTDAGIYLLGGNLQKYNGSQFKSTELITGDSSQFGFELQYGT